MAVLRNGSPYRQPQRIDGGVDGILRGDFRRLFNFRRQHEQRVALILKKVLGLVLRQLARRQLGLDLRGVTQYRAKIRCEIMLNLRPGLACRILGGVQHCGSYARDVHGFVSLVERLLV